MTQTNANPDNLHTVSAETLSKVLRDIDLLPKLDQWVVIDPQGNLYRGTIEQMTGVLMRQHPLMRPLSSM